MPVTHGLALYDDLSVLAARKQEELDVLQRLIIDCLHDHCVTDDEIDGIIDYLESTGLSAEHYREVALRAFERVIGAYVSSQRLTVGATLSLRQIGRKLDIPTKTIERAIKQNEIYTRLHVIPTLPFSKLPAMHDSGIALMPAETDYVTFSAALFEQLATSHSTGRRADTGFMVMSGLRDRVGETCAEIIAAQGLSPVSQGDLTVTNQRIVFNGDRESVRAAFAKIHDIELFEDGLRFSVLGREHPVIVQFVTSASAEVVGIYISRVINQ